MTAPIRIAYPAPSERERASSARTRGPLQEGPSFALGRASRWRIGRPRLITRWGYSIRSGGP